MTATPSDLQIGGAPVVTITAADAPPAGPAILDATVLPGRGMMLLQASLRLPSGEIVDAIHAPAPAEAAKALSGGEDDFAGNRSFTFGGCLLAPFANRIRGRALPGAREIESLIDGRPVRLLRNWGGKAAGAEQYAMHGFLLDAEVPFEAEPDRIRGHLAAGDFGGRWPGRVDLDFEYRLERGGLVLRIDARNAGEGPLPLGLGWHPLPAPAQRPTRPGPPAAAGRPARRG
ncbi:hypothetical protein [Phenylobacterium sp. J367]|uniref:aldose epimerase family protein n=1 Tax=Phenylobacterium sp. J367 TaxID=2898435 RepID=UPI002150C69B|nr:hypothetical protein [Phenylobacterium sp. J367]MCR5879734.1 hypothetical protein [Phenylobacterium sp. J367]